MSGGDTLEEALPRASLVLEPLELEVLARVWELLRGRGEEIAMEGRDHLGWAILRLDKIREAIEVHPSILRGQTLGARHRDLGSLIATFSSCQPSSAEAFLPTRGVLVRAFLHAKLNFCRLLGLIVAELLPEGEGVSEVRGEIEHVQTSAVCNIIAEDLLRMIAGDDGLAQELRRRATWVLVQMWEGRSCQVVPRFFPVLDSVWQAKSHLSVTYGTLSGASELLSILSQGVDPLFAECFGRDAVGDDEEYALQEFVFNFSYEELQRLQQHMEETGETSFDAARVATLLGVALCELHVQTCTCEEMITTFRERQAMANHRRAVGLPGPKRTAEQYVMTYLLEQAGDLERQGCEGY